ncbi:MAG: head maturation protease, ClpP-related [Anaerovoracaceae bacterium]|nr:Clp protease ClpP [Dehalococcoidia bacterium]
MPKNKFWQFRNQGDSKVGELLLYGIIESSTWWGDEVTPQSFKKELDALGDIDVLNIYINSDGGDPFAAHAMYNMVKRHKAKKNVHIDGLAASAASDFAMVGDTIYMPENAMMMIHNPWIIAAGNANDFRKMADDLDNIRKSSIANYQSKSGLSDEKIIEIMDAETWLTAKEAKDLGFADEIKEEKQVAACLDAGILTMNGVKMDLSRYRNPPKLIVSGTKPPKTTPQNNPNELDKDQLFLLENALQTKKSKYQEVK